VRGFLGNEKTKKLLKPCVKIGNIKQTLMRLLVNTENDLFESFTESWEAQ